MTIERKCFMYAGLILLLLLQVVEMGEVVVKIPEKLKERMSKLSWIDWASVAKKKPSQKDGKT